MDAKGFIGIVQGVYRGPVYSGINPPLRNLDHGSYGEWKKEGSYY